jgi:hypothetical protein
LHLHGFEEIQRLPENRLGVVIKSKDNPRLDCNPKSMDALDRRSIIVIQAVQFLVH